MSGNRMVLKTNGISLVLIIIGVVLMFIGAAHLLPKPDIDWWALGWPFVILGALIF